MHSLVHDEGGVKITTTPPHNLVPTSNMGEVNCTRLGCPKDPPFNEVDGENAGVAGYGDEGGGEVWREQWQQASPHYSPAYSDGSVPAASDGLDSAQ